MAKLTPRTLLVFGTRPEAIKLAPVVHALRAVPGMDVRVAVTGQHRAMLDQVLAFNGIVPDHDLDVMRADQSLDALTARLLTGLGALYDAARPARVVVQGDTATAMVGALAAYHRKIPVAHVEAGLRSGDMHHPWPEEGNRKIVAALADLHFAPTRTAADALLAEHVAPATIHTVGNTVIDALLAARARIAAEPALAAALDPLLAGLAGKRMVLVTTHRRENHGGGMTNIAHAIRRIAARPDVAVVFPVHPNPNVRPVMAAILEGQPNVAMIEPQDYPHFVRLLDACHLVLTDSGGIQEEAPSFGKPVLVMRETTERPEGVAAGTAKLIGADEGRIVSEVFTLLDDSSAYAAMARAHNPFGDGQSSRRIVEVMLRDAGSAA